MRGEIGFGSAGAKSENDSEGVIPRAGKPVVVDADALNWLAGQQAWWERVPAGQLVLTPHAGEMARLTGFDVEEIVGSPARCARQAANQWGQQSCSRVLKHWWLPQTNRFVRRDPSVSGDCRKRGRAERLYWRIARPGACSSRCCGSCRLCRQSCRRQGFDPFRYPWSCCE